MSPVPQNKTQNLEQQKFTVSDEVKFTVDAIQSDYIKHEKIAYKCNLLGETDKMHLELM